MISDPLLHVHQSLLKLLYYRYCNNLLLNECFTFHVVPLKTYILNQLVPLLLGKCTELLFWSNLQCSHYIFLDICGVLTS